MRSVLLVFAAVVMLPAPSTGAEHKRQPKPDKPVSAGQQLPLKGARAANSCAEYGAGFVRVEGTATCVKIGGAVSIGVGSSR